MRGGMILVWGIYRTEVRTLTTKLVITMTIDVRIIKTPDISVANEVFNLRQVKGHNCLGLSATGFFARR